MNYTDRYQPDGKFDLQGMVTNDNLHVVGEIILIFLFVTFFAYGGYNLYYLFGYIQDYLATHSLAVLDPIFGILKEYSWQTIVVLVAVYYITLQVSYFVVRLFGKLAAVFLYGTTILQIVLFLALYFYVPATWEYRWIFLVPVALQAFVLIFWRKKLNLAILYVKASSAIVWKKRKLMIPQLVQTLWIIALSVFYFATVIAVFFDITNLSFTVRNVTVSQTWIFVGYTGLFVFCVYIVFYVVLGMKIDMVHSYVRSRGKDMSLKHAWSIARRRWWGLMGYALWSTLIHMMQYFYKIIKREINVESIAGAAKLTKEVIPSAPMSADGKGGKSKKPPLRERIWMGLNYFTLPALILEDRLFFGACFRSLHIVTHNIPDLYIKHANVGMLFKMMRISSIFLSGLLGGVIGELLAWGLEISAPWNYVLILACVVIFVWLSGTTSVLVLNDLNLCYISVMFLHTIDDINGKGHEYIDFVLPPQSEVEAKTIAKDQEKAAKEQKKAAKKGKGEPELPPSPEAVKPVPKEK